MSDGFGNFTREEMCTILDALANYIECSGERRIRVIEKEKENEKRVGSLSVRAQLDESVKDIRDEAIGLDNLIKRRLECFEQLNMTAYSLYKRILCILEKDE